MALTNTQIIYIIILLTILYLLYNYSKKNNKNTVAKEPFSLMDTIKNNLDKVTNSGFVSSIKNIV